MCFDIDITVKRAEQRISCMIHSKAGLVALTGPSGAGKTSILHCIAGLLRPEQGHIAIGGKTLFDSVAHIDLPVNRRGAGYVFQDLRLFPHYKVRSNLTYGQKSEQETDHGTDRRIQFDDVVSLLDIGPLLDRWPSTLSGGEARRVAIGRALLSSPHFLLLDEPTASLDRRRADDVIERIELLRDEWQIPVIYVSHMHDEITRLADEIIPIDQNSS
ncbi:MAG: ATP-binding cassette domain-containing protein [Sphingomonadaceae bacterium]